MPDVHVEGVRIHYEATAPRDDRLPLLLSHGYSASGRMWAPNLAALSAERRVITWDMRGHGTSDSPTEPASYSEALAVADMTAVLDATGAERAVVGGLSLGGYLSLAFFLSHRERVAALVLCNTGPGFKRDEPREAWNLQAEQAACAWEKGQVAPSADRPEMEPLSRQSATGLALAARGMVTQHDRRVIDALPTIDVPTLVVVGDADAGFRAAADYMAAKIGGAELAVIEHAGHASNIDQPEAFDRVLLEFLARVP